MSSSTRYRLIHTILDTSEPPETWQFDLAEIREILEYLPRYLGRSQRTVWEHSKAVAVRAVKKLPAQSSGGIISACYERALYHDASEAFTGDVPGPIKCLLGEGFRIFESKIQNRVYSMLNCSSRQLVERFGSVVEKQIVDAVKAADEEDYEWEQTTMFTHSKEVSGVA